MTAQPDPRIKEIQERIKEKERFKALPKCDICGSQLRRKDDVCICGGPPKLREVKD